MYGLRVLGGNRVYGFAKVLRAGLHHQSMLTWTVSEGGSVLD